MFHLIMLKQWYNPTKPAAEGEKSEEILTALQILGSLSQNPEIDPKFIDKATPSLESESGVDEVVLSQSHRLSGSSVKMYVI